VRILVADDSAIKREVSCEALSRMGIAADTAENGREAFEAAVSQPFDCIFMDVSMPDIDGYESCRRIRAHEAQNGLPRMPIIALTAHVVGTSASAWKDAGMDGVLHKPFSIAGLAKTLLLHVEPAVHLAPAGVPTEASPAVPNMAAGPDETSAEALLDLESLSNLSTMAANGTPGFLERILGLYFDHAPRGLEELSAQIAAGDAEGVAQAAHALRSMSVNIGARKLAARLSEIERDARRDGITPSEGEGEKIEVLLRQTLKALRVLFDQHEIAEPQAPRRQATQ
jgi:CheY-like chemotaxis protein